MEKFKNVGMDKGTKLIEEKIIKYKVLWHWLNEKKLKKYDKMITKKLKMTNLVENLNSQIRR